MNNEINIYWLAFHLIQVIIFQFYAAPRFSRLTYVLLKKRNPEEIKKVLPNQLYLHQPNIDYTLGGLCIVLLILGHLINNPLLYWTGKYLSVFGLILSGVIIDLYRYKKYEKSIPLISKRSASLETRNVGQIIPFWAWIPWFIGSLISYSFLQDIKSQLSLAITGLFLFGIGLAIEKRKKLPLHIIDDDLYRKSEAWATYLIAWSLIILIPFKNHLKGYGIDALVSIVPMILFLLFLNSNIYKKILNS